MNQLRSSCGRRVLLAAVVVGIGALLVPSTATPGAAHEPTPGARETSDARFPSSRDPYTWPFRARSIWNMPLGSDAVYVKAGLRRSSNKQTQPDEEFIGLDPNDPVKRLTSDDDGALGRVHVPPGFTRAPGAVPA